MHLTFESIADRTELLTELDLSLVAPGGKKRFWIQMITDALGLTMFVPVLVARGKKDGPVLGLTAALHGNEINGIPVIQRLFRELDPEELHGSVVGVLVANLPSFLNKERRFVDETDLNHIMPGVEDGNVSQVYAYRLMERIVKKFDYLLDLHTASRGRINSYYVRADLDDPETRQMAILQNAQIILHNPPSDSTLRGASESLGIKAITLEVGNPQVFQKGIIRSGLTGIHNLLAHLNMVDTEIEFTDGPAVVCERSLWMYTDTGGIMTVHPSITQMIKKGERVASVYNVFGDLVTEYQAPVSGIVIGKSVDPVNQTGGRVLHLGILQT